MSHIWAGRLAYLLGIVLLGAAVLFGWGHGG